MHNTMKKIIFAITLTSIIGSCSEKRENVATMSLPIEVASPVVQEVTLTREYPHSKALITPLVKE